MENVLEIIAWYKNNFRDLPWRNTKDPYKIWLSEIILQQTQVVQGLGYYERFVSQYPDIQSLASADQESVLKLWQGLGYYSRARNLHKTAQIIVNQYDGKFPDQYQAVLKLPGIGPYTAAAIMSFAFDQAYPCLDGNVYRVLSRLYGIESPIDDNKSRPEFMAILEAWVQGQQPSLFNNAIMEFGAMLCKPDAPKCAECPVSFNCKALKMNAVQNFPVKAKTIKKRQRFFNYFLIQQNGQIAIRKRQEKDIWQHLYELPLVESKQLMSANVVHKEIDNILFNRLNKIECLSEAKHVLTHQTIHAQFWIVEADGQINFKASDVIWVPITQIQNYPVSVLIEKFLVCL
jgi:A/G-specific adenine glycosylase